MRSVTLAIRIVVVVALCSIGIWQSWKLAWANHLYREDTPDSLRSALRFAPDSPYYYMRLSQLDPDHARELLEQAVQADRYNAEADIELGLTYEADGDNARAEKLLLNAFEVDHTYLPRWSLANFYFRRDNTQLFWKWARIAAQMPSDDMGPLFQLCWREAPDPATISDAILNDQPDLLYQYTAFLLNKDQIIAASAVAQRLIRVGNRDAFRPMVMSVVDRLIVENHGNEAQQLWYALIDAQWVKGEKSEPNNPKFDRTPLVVGFDWAIPAYDGLHSYTGPSGLNSEFTGSQPEDCTVAGQAIVLQPGRYSLQYSYQTTGIPQESGLHWQILDPASNSVIATSQDLSSESQQRQDSMEFSVPPSSSALYLRLGYERELGTPRISGSLMLFWAGIHPLS